MERRIADLKDRYIVCAYGRMGRAVVRELEAEGVPLVAIDSKEEVEEDVRRGGHLFIIGDPASEPILPRAGIGRAKRLVCAADGDTVNVYVTIVGRSLNPDIFIVAQASVPESPESLKTRRSEQSGVSLRHQRRSHGEARLEAESSRLTGGAGCRSRAASR